jgi:predicted site-specific integrase-resolvase
MKEEMDKIIKLAANYSISHDINNKDVLAKLTILIIEETLKIAGTRIIFMQEELKEKEPIVHDIDIYGGLVPNTGIDYNKRESNG